MIYPDRRKEILTGVFVFSLLFGGCGLGELMIRVINYQRFGTMMMETFVKPEARAGLLALDPETGIERPRPGFSGGGVQINELGFRSPPLEQPKPPSYIRLAFVGSSSTFDPYAGSQATTFPQLTANALQSLYPASRFDFVNAGIPGLPLPQYEAVLERYIAPIAPDVIVVFPSALAVEAGRIAREKGWSPATSDTTSYFEQFSMLWQLLEKNSTIITRERKALRSDGKVAIDPEEFERNYQERLEAILRRAKSLGSVVVLIQQDGHMQHGQSHEQQLAAAAQEFYALPFLTFDALVDLHDAVDAATTRAAAAARVALVAHAIPGDDMYWEDSTHFQGAGGRLLADAVANRLSESKSFRSLLKERLVRPPSKPEVAKLGQGLKGAVENSQQQ